MGVSKAQEVDVNIVGSSSPLGRYPKISQERTYNMFISDGWLINFAGFKKQIEVEQTGTGRGLFNSIRGGFIIAVIGAHVYQITDTFTVVLVGTIGTSSGDVFMDENLANQICIVDGVNAYVYNYVALTFNVQNLQINGAGPTITPNYVSYHNTFFLFGSAPTSLQNPAFWYAFQPFTGTPPTPAGTPDLQFVSQFSVQTKPDFALAVKRLPGRGNHVLVLGSAVAEVWNQVGGAQNYARVSSLNIDKGLVSTASLAASEEWLCWLAQNENLDISIMAFNGSVAERISTDGIDYILSKIQFPLQSSGFFYRQGAHLFYQLTFSNPVDNLTLIYDFMTKQFFHLSDEKLDFHPARQIVFFIDRTLFVSLTDASIYQTSTDFLTYDYSTSPTSVGDEIPRIRICKSIQMPDTSRFRVGQFTFWIEQGVVPQNAPTAARVDMSVSKNGGQSFSNVVSKELNPVGHYRNQIRWWRLGQANEFIIQLRFYGFQRFVCNDGKASVY